MVYGPGTVGNQIVIQLNEMLLTITGRGDGLIVQAQEQTQARGASPAGVAAAGRAAVAEFEARYGAMIAAEAPLGVPSVSNSKFVRTVFLDEAGNGRAPMRWIVPDDSHVAIYVRPRENLDQQQVDQLVRTIRREVGQAHIGKGVTVTGAPAVAASLGAEVQREVVGASVRSEAVASYGMRLGDLESQRELLRGVEANLPVAPVGVKVEVTGLPVVGSRGYELISERRLAASLAGPVLAGLVLVALLRSRRDGPMTIGASLLAVGWGTLALKVTGVALSPLTVGLGSLTAAVGAEFCVFVLDRLRLGVSKPWAGVVAAAATSAVGFGTLGLSRLAVLRQFGLLLAGSILLALLATRLVVGRRVRLESRGRRTC